MNKSKILLALATIYLTISGVSYAADDTTTDAKVPLTQAQESVDKNLTRDPDSKGLNNASERLEANQTKIEAHKMTKAEKRLAKQQKLEQKKAAKVAEHAEDKNDEANESADKAEHSGKVEHADKADRSDKSGNADKAARPERNQRPERASSNRK
jgi:hypothetical protein